MLSAFLILSMHATCPSILFTSVRSSDLICS
jgi:hypothetical protein